MSSQKVLVLVGVIIHGRPVLSLTPLPPTIQSCYEGHNCRNLVCPAHIKIEQVSLAYTTPRSRPSSKTAKLDLKVGVITIGVLAILEEDFRPQAILELHLLSSLDYSAHQGLSFFRIIFKDNSIHGRGIFMIQLF